AIPGETVLAAGVQATPHAQALATALGYDELSVLRQPRVVALITGDEVIRAGHARPGQVRDAIGPALAGQLRALGARLTLTGYLDDQREVLLGTIANTVAEVVMVTGSSSVGRTDVLRPVLEAMGAQPVVDGVDCRPGHTQSLWRLPDDRLVVGLPGNPFAATVALLTLVAPCCAGLLGREPSPPRRVPIGALRPHRGSTRLIPVRAVGEHLDPLAYTGSAMVRGLASANALAVVPSVRCSPTEVELLALPGVNW
ncbi:MAG TPA: molybdopterin-binding protein, partial [Pseudonocardiaceae bacterium]